MNETETFPAGLLRGFCTVADACVGALVRLPDASVVDGVRRVADLVGVGGLEGVEPGPRLVQRFYDRFFVPASPAYVALFEDSVRGGERREGEGFRFAPVAGRSYDHVKGCYEAAGFDYRLIEGYDLAMQRLCPTSMASELAFLSSLCASAAQASQDDLPRAEHTLGLLRAFARRHAGAGFGKAAEVVREYEDDFYARTCLLAARAVDALGECRDPVDPGARPGAA